MNKKLNIILSLVMAVAFIAVSGVAYSDKKVASADIGTYDLYCFSDGGVLQGYVNQLITNEVIDTYVMNPCYPSAPSSSYDFWDYIDDIYNSDDVQSIDNALIIFEISKTFPIEATDTGDLILPQKLETLFGAWYENGCSIMFISGTTETRFIEYNDFLDYVTIQVDMDLKTLWATNVILQMVQASEENKICNTTMVLDAYLSANLNVLNNGTLETINNWLFYYYMVPYFKTTYYNYFISTSNTMLQFFEDYGIKVLKHQPGNNTDQTEIILNQEHFFNLADGGLISFEQNTLNSVFSFDNELTVSLGSSFYGANSALYWEEMMSQMRGYFTDLPVYMFNPNSVEYQDIEDLYCTGPFFSIYNCIYDYISENDLSVYHNLTDSRCAISYIPLPTGPGGWMSHVSTALSGIYEIIPIDMTDEYIYSPFSVIATSATLNMLYSSPC